MASLIENLMDTLNRESAEYEALVELSKKKTRVVIRGDVEALKLADMIRVLERRPVEKRKMEECQNRLKSAVYQMKQINEHNLELIEKALEMAQFELNLYQSMKSAPETANYNRAAYNDGSVMGSSRGRFDAKQ